MSRILVITTSLRPGSNSDTLAERMIEGAKAAGNEVETVSLKEKDIRFCKGCQSCVRTLKCIIRDDVSDIIEKAKDAEKLVFVTPVYYYGMSGQMKTLLDRLTPLYSMDYKIRKVYMLSVATEDEAFVPVKAVDGLKGWIDCFEKIEFESSLFCGGLSEALEAESSAEKLEEAYRFGLSL